MPKFEVFLSPTNRRWYWRLVGENGEIMAQSEGYANRGNAKRAALNFKKLAPTASVVDVGK